MPENKVSAVLEQTNVDAINSAIAALNSNLPFLIDLNLEEKKLCQNLAIRVLLL